jgi:hypothetical protein
LSVDEPFCGEFQPFEAAVVGGDDRRWAQRWWTAAPGSTGAQSQQGRTASGRVVLVKP